MNTSNLVEWQRIDPSNGLIEPWWTWPFMDVLKSCDLSKLTWLEFGAGRGTAWLRSRCGHVDSIETDPEWAAQADLDCRRSRLMNGYINGAHLCDGVPRDMPMYFTLIPEGVQYDAISVDGIFRNECLEWALSHFRGLGGLLIADNWQQDYVWISPAAEKLMEPYEAHRFYQPGHNHHEGKPWNTTYWIIPR